MTLAGRRVLDFRYAALQLNRMNWRHFARQANPVASALMARMNIAPRERAGVKLQCLRLLATLSLDRQKSHLISDFVDSYLRLDAAEVRIFHRFLEKLPQEERQEIMQITNSWKEEGKVEGLLEGLETALQLKFGLQARPLIQRMQNYSLDALQLLRRKLLEGAQLEEL